MMADQVVTRRPAAKYGILSNLTGFHIRRAQVAMFQHFSESVAPHDVTPGQFGVLSLIAANPGLSQSDLAGALDVDRSTVVAVINRLSARHWVERRPSQRDRRGNALHLTPGGDVVWREITERARQHEEAFLKPLDASEQRQLLDLLRRLAR